MSLVHAWRMLRVHWWIILISVVLGAGAGLAWAFASASYVTTATVLVSPQNEQELQSYNAQPERYMLTQLEIVTSDAVLGRAVDLLGGDATAGDLDDALSVEGGVVDNVVKISAVGSSSAISRERATAVTDVYVDQPTANSRVLAISDPQLAFSRLRRIATGFAAGIVFGLLCAAVFGASRRLVLSLDQLARVNAPLSLYPREMQLRSEGDAAPYDALLSWISLMVPHVSSIRVVDDGGRDVTKEFSSRLSDVSRGWDPQPRVSLHGVDVSSTPAPSATVEVGEPQSGGPPDQEATVLVVERGRVTEPVVEQLSLAAQGNSKASVLAVLVSS